jgi:hypothetical protein
MHQQARGGAADLAVRPEAAKLHVWQEYAILVHA